MASEQQVRRLAAQLFIQIRSISLYAQKANRDRVADNQCPEFKFRLVFFRLQMLRFSALCGQIWQNFCGSLREVKLKVHQISAHLVNRELRNATFEGEKTQT